jgi:DNA-directed RNA polymerase specialized sigma24 family protein
MFCFWREQMSSSLAKRFDTTVSDFQMIHSYNTSMGGENESFQTTCWSEIHDAQLYKGSRRKEIINNLLTRYWKPVYCYLRHKGYDNDSAKDLTQAFFQEIVLGKDLVQQHDETKGRFRTFLLTALNRYIVSAHRAETTTERRPKKGIVSLESFDEASLPIPSEGMKPDEAFAYSWASLLLDEVLNEVEQECYREGKGTYWKVFRERVLKPIIEGTKPRPLAELCRQLGIRNETKASNMIVTLKRRFRAVMRNQLRCHVSSDEEANQEVCDLITILSKTHKS